MHSHVRSSSLAEIALLCWTAEDGGLDATGTLCGIVDEPTSPATVRCRK